MRSLYRLIKALAAVVLIFSLMLVQSSTPTLADETSTSSCFDEEDLIKYDEKYREVIKLKAKPIIGGYWEDPLPTIRVCAGSGVTESRLNRAINYWKKLGYDLKDTRFENRTHTCINNGNFGEITILLFEQGIMSGDHLAVTRTHKSADTGEILKAEIFINRYAAEKPLVLEHEIGHALGWLHFNVRHHIMNARYPLCGHTSSGLNGQRYESEVRRIKAIIP
jgi:hypothetical protein